MKNLNQYILNLTEPARLALKTIDSLLENASKTLFIVDDNNRMVGSLTDGDIRRGLLNGLEISHPISEFMNKDFKYIHKNDENVSLLKALRAAKIQLVPVLGIDGVIVDIIDLTQMRTLLPAAALIMAGGRGERLKPFTDKTPKPMLLVGNKPIIEHNIDRLIQFGVSDIYISVKYLQEQIMDYFGDGSGKGVNIKYIIEEEPLGTIGALSLIEKANYDHLIVMNSDVLTNVDFEDFFEFYQKNNADMVVASIPYVVNVPYAVLETDQHSVVSFTEKPTYTYYSNGGIYIMKFALKNILNYNSFFNATDLMDFVIESEGYRLVHYPLLCYWLDIGKHHDYVKAQEDIKYLNI
ncbi:nucleotidyltransferase family protein [Mucilaginibacter calamicampi]|uniref:Nucleotidyltransferase family protein n=1 Tax=Mucilaginibacter calamicampi TaxID=1302352 RepID=A0ABW2YWB6_9SPHI